MDIRFFRLRLLLLALWLPLWLIVLAMLHQQGSPNHADVVSLFGITTLIVFVINANVLQALLVRAEFWMVVFSIVVGLVAAEFVLVPRLVDDDFAKNIRSATQPAGWRFVPHHYLGFIVNYRTGINTDRYRHEGDVVVPKPEGTYRIVAIGGSTTFGTSVDPHEAYPQQLQQVLREEYDYTNVEVINAGHPDYSSWETLNNLQFRALDLQPDLVIIYQNTNDVHARLVRPENYRGDNGGRRHGWDFNEQRKGESWVWSVPSTLFHQVMLATGLADVPDNGIDVLVSQSCTGQTSNAGCLGRSWADTLAANPPTYYERNIRSMVGASRANGAEVLLLTWAFSDSYGDYAATPEYIAAFGEHNDIMANIAVDLGTHFYDLVPDMPKDREYWADNRHMNAQGNRIRAEFIAAYLHEASVLPAPQ